MLYNREEDPSPDMNRITDETILLAKKKHWYVLDGETPITTGIRSITEKKESEKITVSSDGRHVNFTAGSGQWMLYTVSGRLVGQGTSLKADFPTLPTGAYLLRHGKTTTRLLMK